VKCTEGWLEDKRNKSLGRRPEVEEACKVYGHKDYDTYYDEKRGLRWRVKPEHFVYEDENAAVHLVRIAFGGSRRELFCGIVTDMDPSKTIRDDVTVQVVFFDDV